MKTFIKKTIARASQYVFHLESKNIRRELQRRALSESTDYVLANMAMVRPFADRFALLDATLDLVTIQGLCCEFGVFEGESINYLARRAPALKFFGFDSFEGLPEDWRPEIRKGHFKSPRAFRTRSNVTLVKGLFAETVPAFLDSHPGPVAFLHIDCDLYSSTRTVFELLAPRIVAGTVIVFDEFFNYPGWKEGERKAFDEFVRDHNLAFDFVGFAVADSQVAVMIK